MLHHAAQEGMPWTVCACICTCTTLPKKPYQHRSGTAGAVCSCSSFRFMSEPCKTMPVLSLGQLPRQVCLRVQCGVQGAGNVALRVSSRLPRYSDQYTISVSDQALHKPNFANLWKFTPR